MYTLLLTTPIKSYSPSADVQVSGWVGNSASDLFNNIDEDPVNTTDYILSPTIGTGNPAIFKLSSSIYSGTYTININAKYLGTSGQVRISLLDDSNTQQGVSPWQALSSSNTTYSFNVTTTGLATRVRIEVQA